MDFPVVLAGHRTLWTFKGSHQLGSWLESQPWLKGGGVIQLAIGADGDVDLIVDSIRRGVRAADDAGHHPTVVPISIEGTLLKAMSAHMCGSEHADERQLIEECSYGHKLIVAVAPDTHGAVAREAVAFSDRARKSIPDFGSAFVVVVNADSADDGALDFTSGAPADHVLYHLDDTQDRLFHAYLHTRIGWEAAGSIARSRCLEASVATARVGDDEAVEKAFNDFSLTSFEDIPITLQQELGELLSALGRNAAATAKRLGSRLRDGRILWSPFGRDRFRFAPWVSRALLLRGSSTDNALLLRNQMICAPLVRELLGRCLELEARERAKLSSDLGGTAPPTEAIGRLSAFARGDVQGDGSLYPKCSPARPQDAWAFAEFGTYVDAVERTGASRRHIGELHILRQLRNALAHGHYAGWAALRRLVDVERRLGPTF